MCEGEDHSSTPRIQAAINGHADAVRVLISRGAEVNKAKPCNGSTALHVAALNAALSATAARSVR